jgi:hypothetical protein
VKARFIPIIVVAGLLAAPALAQSEAPKSKPAAEKKAAEAAPAPKPEPAHIKVQHILIGYRGSVPGKNITRSKEQAKELAYKLLALAQEGADFSVLVKENTDDAYPGIYGMSNLGVAPAQGEYARNKMVAAFGDTGFPLEVGEIGIADADRKKSPYGWHIVKRIE